MAGSRTLKLSILADVDDLKKKLGTAETEVEGFGGKLEKFGKVAAAAFAAAAAAAAAYAGKLAIDGVKAAIEDEAAQKRLATALENVTGATDAQIASVEEQILKQSLATGVADDKLRPALQRLATSTGDVQKSQDLLSLALDIAAAKGISVETAANALAKAYDGNTGALTRLGVGLSAADIKALGFDGTIQALSETFGGAAKTQAETFEGRIARLKVTFDEAKESVGTALLPILDKLITFFTETAIPAFGKLKKDAIDPVIAAVEKNRGTFEGLYNFAKDTLAPFLGGALLLAVKGLSTVASTIVSAVATALRALEPIINAAITGINAVIRAKNLLSSGPDTPTINKVDFSNLGKTVTQPNTVAPGGLPFGNSAGGGKLVGGGGNLLAGGATTTPSIPSTTPSISTTTISSVPTVGGAGIGVFTLWNPAMARRADEAGRVTINVNAPSIIDEEGFNRAVVSALNNSEYRSGGGGGQLVL